MEYFWTLLFITTVHVVQPAPVKKRMVDLTHVFDNGTLHHPIHKKFEIHVTHNGTWNDGPWVQLEEYNSPTHAGTHMDAPSHFVKGGLNIDELPLEKFIAPAAVVDVEAQAAVDRDYLVTIHDLEDWENTTGQMLDHVILLIRTGWSKKYDDVELYSGTADRDATKLHYPGISAEASQWLVDYRNIYGIGIDAFSFDNGPSQDFPSHQIILGAGIFALENVDNLGELPLYGAKLYVMPMKMGKASGAPTRIIATYPYFIHSKVDH